MLTSVSAPRGGPLPPPLVRPVVVSEFSAPTAPGAMPIAQWTVYSDGHVEHTSDGVVWKRPSIDPLVHIVAGAAPSTLVCWLVGQRGIVLVTSDGGERFSHVDLATSVDLAAVRATDAQRASVTAVDGRTFTTTDGGRSWQ
jgi:photosystem II stability/assembly factor-like uncharacterized protein